VPPLNFLKLQGIAKGLDKMTQDQPEVIKNQSAPKNPLDTSKKRTGGRPRKAKKRNHRWVISVTFISILLSALFSFLSIRIFDSSGIVVSLAVLLFIISLGIIFDMIGIAVTAADETPFHGMSARKLIGAGQSVKLIRNAEKVSSFCNDVVGDICGIISGAAAGLILIRMALDPDTNIAASIGITALVTGLTIGGKAAGKSIAIKHSGAIVHWVGVILSVVGKKKKKKRIVNKNDKTV
jgi:hypothetical protein